MVVAGDMLFEAKHFDINGVVEFFNANQGKTPTTGHTHSLEQYCPDDHNPTKTCARYRFHNHRHGKYI